VNGGAPVSRSGRRLNVFIRRFVFRGRIGSAGSAEGDER
jgi:hypothetical protein